MNIHQSNNAAITTQALRDLGFQQLEANSYSNGKFDLILSDMGSVILYGNGSKQSVNCITNMQLLRTFVHCDIIASMGFCRQ